MFIISGFLCGGLSMICCDLVYLGLKLVSMLSSRLRLCVECVSGLMRLRWCEVIMSLCGSISLQSGPSLKIL